MSHQSQLNARRHGRRGSFRLWRGGKPVKLPRRFIALGILFVAFIWPQGSATGVAETYDQPLFGALRWRSVGPYRRAASRLSVAGLSHPYGPNVERGVFRSTDGGRTFQKVLCNDENSGASDL